MKDQLARSAGWGAIAYGVLMYLNLVAFVLFFAVEYDRAVLDIAQGRQGFYLFGFLNDLLTGITPAALLGLAFLWHRAAPPRMRAWSRFAVLGCVIAAAVNLVAFVLLFMRVIGVPQQGVIVMGAFLPLGLWMIVANRLAQRAGGLSSRLAAFGVVCGAACVLGGATAILFGAIAWLSGTGLDAVMSNPLYSILSGIGVAVGGLGSPAWAILVGRGLIRSTVPRRTNALSAGTAL